jgi:NAD(P)H dehydrogenase (quinone)
VSFAAQFKIQSIVDMKKILIINGHPNQNSFCNALADAYHKGSELGGHEVELLHLRDLEFTLDLSKWYSLKSELEPDLIKAQQLITWANHIVVIHPVWWGSVPALLKAFFDRALTSGYAFRPRENSHSWDKLLSGKTGHLIYTGDTPTWVYKLFYKAPSVHQVKKIVLEYCGITPVKVTAIAPIRASTEEFRKQWLSKIEEIAKN